MGRNNEPVKKTQTPGMRGSLAQYAALELVQTEEGAWERVAVERHSAFDNTPSEQIDKS